MHIDNRNDNDEILKNAANDVYEAVVENEEDYDQESHDSEVQWLREERERHKSIMWLKRPTVLNVCFVVLLFAMSYFTGVSAQQVVTAKLACNSLALVGEVCNPAEVQALLSNLSMAFKVASAVFMLIASGKIGSLSDRYGRKMFLWINMLFIFLGKAMQYYYLSRYEELKFVPLVLAEILASLCGGISTFMTIVNCYISDVVEQKERIYSLGLGISSLFIGITLGPILGNIAESWSGVERIDASQTLPLIHVSPSELNPIRLELWLMFFNFLYTLFILPESRSQRARRFSRSQSFSNLEGASRLMETVNFLSPLKTLWLSEANMKRAEKESLESTISEPTSESPSESSLPRRPSTSESSPSLSRKPSVSFANPVDSSKLAAYRKTIVLLILMECTFMGLSSVMGEVHILYGLFTFHWKQTDIGNLLAITAAARAVVLIVLSPIFNHKILTKRLKLTRVSTHFDMHDWANCIIGYLFESVSYISLYFAPNSSAFVGFSILAAFGSIAIPTIASSVIKFYPESKIGEVYGAITILKNVANLVFPVVVLSAYKFFLNTLGRPALIYVLVGCIWMVFMGALFYIKRILKI